VVSKILPTVQRVINGGKQAFRCRYGHEGRAKTYSLSERKAADGQIDTLVALTPDDRAERRRQLFHRAHLMTTIYPGEMLECALTGAAKNVALELWQEYSEVLDPNTFCRATNSSPLQTAAKENNGPLITYLLSIGAVAHLDGQTRNALYDAASHTYIEPLQQLLKMNTWTTQNIAQAMGSVATTYCSQANEAMALLVNELTNHVRQGHCRETLYGKILEQTIFEVIRSWNWSRDSHSRMFKVTTQQAFFRILALLAFGANPRFVKQALDLHSVKCGQSANTEGYDNDALIRWGIDLSEKEREILQRCLAEKDGLFFRVGRAERRLKQSEDHPGESAPERMIDMDDVLGHSLEKTETIRSALNKVLGGPKQGIGKIWTFLGTEGGNLDLMNMVQERMAQALDFLNTPELLENLDKVCSQINTDPGCEISFDVRNTLKPGEEIPKIEMWRDPNPNEADSEPVLLDDSLVHKFFQIQWATFLTRKSQKLRIDFSLARIFEEALNISEQHKSLEPCGQITIHRMRQECRRPLDS
jgi:hypothetical protein